MQWNTKLLKIFTFRQKKKNVEGKKMKLIKEQAAKWLKKKLMDALKISFIHYTPLDVI